MLMVLPDFDMIVHTVFLYFFLYHKTYYTAHPKAGKIKKALSEDRAFNIKKQLSQAASGHVSRRSSLVSRTNKKALTPPQ